MTQRQALAILDGGYSVFLTGPAGSGKTHVLREFIREARDNGKSVAVTASTGLAATHLSGNTIHSWAGIGIADELQTRTVRDMSKSRREQINKADVLIIDEVSMLHDFRLDMVDQVCQKIRESQEPFGGLQVVLSGDFYQLPPVNRSEAKHGGFVVESEAWDALEPVVCYLSEQHRQRDDPLLEILSALRANDLRRRHAEALLARKTARTPFDDPVTELYTKNINVDSVNRSRLEAMDGEVHEYEMTSTGRKGGVESLKKSCLAPETLRLKQGAFVMFVKNSQNKTYVNGTLGTVVGFEDDEDELPIVETKNGRKITVEPDTWELRDGEKKIASISQLPLRLAWAITVHKSQGMTLDAAHIDLGNAFVPGMGYVALSRVKSLDTLTLAGLNKVALQLDEAAHRIDEDLRKRSKTHQERHAHLEEAYEKKRAKKAKKPKKKSASWQEKIEKMRQEYPNAYKPWKKLEDKTLLEAWAEGKTVKQLSAQMGRHTGSIRARLKKHLGDDLFAKNGR
ncbi:MAG: PIF1 family DEAD/DEAH box helicase [Candidatus Saccharibacteria bacterium]|nr:PIF1 family DEAD/DEAH box helicase [Candidatus Saccharibacteria bacterium]